MKYLHPPSDTKEIINPLYFRKRTLQKHFEEWRSSGDLEDKCILGSGISTCKAMICDQKMTERMTVRMSVLKPVGVVMSEVRKDTDQQESGYHTFLWFLLVNYKKQPKDWSL